MERLFKVQSVFRDTIEARNEGEAPRDKVEVTLTYHETYYSSQAGPGIRRQQVIVTLLDQNAVNWTLQPGSWIVGSISLAAYPHRTIAGRQNQSVYLDRYVPVTDWNVL